MVPHRGLLAACAERGEQNDPLPLEKGREPELRVVHSDDEERAHGKRRPEKKPARNNESSRTCLACTALQKETGKRRTPWMLREIMQ